MDHIEQSEIMNLNMRLFGTIDNSHFTCATALKISKLYGNMRFRKGARHEFRTKCNSYIVIVRGGTELSSNMGGVTIEVIDSAGITQTLLLGKMEFSASRLTPRGMTILAKMADFPMYVEMDRYEPTSVPHSVLTEVLALFTHCNIEFFGELVSNDLVMAGDAPGQKELLAAGPAREYRNTWVASTLRTKEGMH